MGAERLAVLLQHVGVEEVAVIAGIATSSRSAILDVLGLGVGCAELWVVWTREEMCSNACLWVRVSTAAFLWVVPSRRGDRSSGICLGITVGARDDDLEVSTTLTSVGGGCAVDIRSPECALVVGD